MGERVLMRGRPTVAVVEKGKMNEEANGKANGKKNI